MPPTLTGQKPFSDHGPRPCRTYQWRYGWLPRKMLIVPFIEGLLCAYVSSYHSHYHLVVWGYHLPLISTGTEMFSNLPKIPQLSPLSGIQTQVSFIPNLSMFHLNKNREKHLLSIHYVLRPLGATETQSSGGEKNECSPLYHKAQCDMECKSREDGTLSVLLTTISPAPGTVPGCSQELFVE